MNTEHHINLDQIMQHLIADGTEAVAEIMTTLLNAAMRIERERFLGAQHYERTPGRRSASGRRYYANGTQRKWLLTPYGRLRLSIPKTRNHPDGVPFYPDALEKGNRPDRAMRTCLAESYLRGLSTRRVEKMLARLELRGVSKDQVSRCVAALDPAFQRWREQPLGEFRYLVLDAHYDKVRTDGTVASNAVLTAVGVEWSGHRRFLGLTVGRSEAETLWRDFLENRVARGLHGVELVTEDHHPGLGRAVQSVFPAAHLQRCQFHLSRNAAHHAPTRRSADRIPGELRTVWNAADRAAAERALAELVVQYRPVVPRLADWLEAAVPEGLPVFRLPPTHRRRMRTTNLLERLHREVRRRTRQVGVFPNAAAVERLLTGIYIEIDEEWETNPIPYIKFNSLEEPKYAT